MANLIADSQQTTFPAFADRKLLAQLGTRFCIDDVKLHTQKDGKTRWYLTIRYAEMDEVEVRTLTFDQSPSRDDMFTLMIDTGDFPQHRCYVENRSFKNTSTGMTQNFYKLGQDKSGECTCGIVVPPKEENADLAFLPDDLEN